MSLRTIIPNLFTAANLLSGFSAIVILLIIGNLDWALYAILLAAAIDLLDGFLARLLKGQTKFGKEFDSLADIVSFGFAPAMVLLYSLFFLQQIDGLLAILLTAIPSMIYLLAIAIRLAWFNTDESQNTDFRGLASPAAAIALMSFLVFMPDFLLKIDNVLIFIPLLISAMMLIPVRVMSLKFNKSRAHLFFALLTLLSAIALIAFYGLKSLCLIVFIYYAGGVIMYYLSNRLITSGAKS